MKASMFRGGQWRIFFFYSMRHMSLEQDSKKTFRPDITRVHVVVSGILFQVYSQGMKTRDTWEEIFRRFGKENSAVNATDFSAADIWSFHRSQEFEGQWSSKKWIKIGGYEKSPAENQQEGIRFKNSETSYPHPFKCSAQHHQERAWKHKMLMTLILCSFIKTQFLHKEIQYCYWSSRMIEVIKIRSDTEDWQVYNF